jgi:glycosyltransferase involved in cell wall biosynthesis
MTDTAILLPTRGRVYRLPRLINNIRDTAEHPYHIYFIVDADDKETLDFFESNKSPTHSLIINEKRCPRTSMNYNRGYQETTEPFFVILGDDMICPQGWLRLAHEKIGDKGVLAFGDKYSEGWGFFMVRREYIQQHSGVVDKPNQFFHEYGHEYADAEFQFIARSRNQIVYSNICFEHQHPYRLGRMTKDDNGNVKVVEEKCVCEFPYLENYEFKSLTWHKDRFEVVLVPKNPVMVDDNHTRNADQEQLNRDKEDFMSRAHLWGGQTKETIFKQHAV